MYKAGSAKIWQRWRKFDYGLRLFFILAIQKSRELLLYPIALITLFDMLVNETTKTDKPRKRESIHRRTWLATYT